MITGWAGWVLANARASAPGGPSAAELAKSLHVHRSQIGRWESDQVQPSYAICERYEETLGYEPGQLSATIEILTPTRGGRPMLLRDDRPRDDDRLADLLDQALAGEPTSGEEWRELGRSVANRPEIFLRRRDWDALLHRLIVEMGLSHGYRYEQFWLAARHLASHPRAAASVERAAREWLNDDSRPAYCDVASITQHAVAPNRVAPLHEQIMKPASPVALWASLIGYQAHVRTMRLDVLRSTPALDAVQAWARDRGVSGRVRWAANEVLALAARRLRPQAWAASGDGRTRVPPVGRLPTPPDLARTVATECLNACAEQGGGSDATLGQLLFTTLTSVDAERRGELSSGVARLPQAPVIAEVLARHLDAAHAGGGYAGIGVLQLLNWTGYAGDGMPLARTLVDDRTPDQAATAAAGALSSSVDAHGPEGRTVALDAVERWARGRVGRHHGRGDDRARLAALVLHTAGREQALDDLAALARERGDASWAAATSAWRQSA